MAPKKAIALKGVPGEEAMICCCGCCKTDFGTDSRTGSSPRNREMVRGFTPALTLKCENEWPNSRETVYMYLSMQNERKRASLSTITPAYYIFSETADIHKLMT